MQELIPTINNIIKYGLQPHLPGEEKELILEKDLVKLYSLYFQFDFKFDETEYNDIDVSKYPNLRPNVCLNFPEYGYYKTHVDITDMDHLSDNAVGDAIDDLTDIIRDLLEIKWRIENNSLADGLWYFKLIFPTHTQQHILDLLNYMNHKNQKPYGT